MDRLTLNGASRRMKNVLKSPEESDPRGLLEPWVIGAPEGCYIASTCHTDVTAQIFWLKNSSSQLLRKTASSDGFEVDCGGRR